MMLDSFQKTKYKSANIQLEGFNLSRQRGTDICLNLKGDGSLKSIGGFEEDESINALLKNQNKSLSKVFFYHFINDGELQEKIICLIEGKLYLFENKAFILLTNSTFNEPLYEIEHTLVDGTKVLILYGENGLYYYDGTSIITVNTSKIKTACIYKERLFYVDESSPCVVRYSNVLDVADFTDNIYEGGWFRIYNINQINKISIYQDNVYLFGDYDIFKIDLDSNPEDFNIIPLSYSGSKIVEKSVVGFQDKIVFCNEKEFCVLSKENFKNYSFDELFDKGYILRNVGGVAYSNQYVFGIKRLDGYNEYELVALVNFSDLSIIFVCQCLENLISAKGVYGEELYACHNGRLFSYKKENEKLMEFVYGCDVELGGVGKSFVNSLRVEGTGKFDLIFENDWKVKRRYSVINSKKLPVKMLGNSFKIKILSKSKKLFIKKIVVEYNNVD